MGLLSTLFGTPKIVDTVADTVKSGVGMLDNAFYTDQEKAADAGKMMDLWLEIQKTTASENSIRSITRRVLAWIIMGAYVLIVLAACALWKLDAAWAQYILNLLTETNLSYLALIVGFFYFGSYAIGQYMRK
ncbi:MAG: hypothetical protein WC261_10505 [Synergistaceae bacterium]|jgi:hypothetical protein